MIDRVRLLGYVLALALGLGAACCYAAKMKVEDLGNGKFRIGAIDLDKSAHRFEVAGHVISQEAIDAPMEFLAVSKGAMKSYEAVLELDTSAIAFNTACILIGLDADHATLPRYHFDPKKLKGDPVALTLIIEDNGSQRELPMTDLILVNGKAPRADWVYTGSHFSSNGHYMAEDFGTLIGVVHDEDSIIQHRIGLGLGNYGAVTVNPALKLKPNQEVRVRVSAEPDKSTTVE